jgi:sirohydrochlorin ferrochelatase
MENQSLLIISHGSKSAAWNHAIQKFCSGLKALSSKNNLFDDVNWCFLEHSQPTIQAALEHQCSVLNKNLVAMPFFLTVGHHVSVDIPKEIEESAKLVERKEGITLYECNNRKIQLIPPPPTVDLISQNIESRLTRLNITLDENGVMIVFYGAKKYLSQWNHLAFNIQSRLTAHFPNTNINWGYGGEAVDFSPDYLTIELQKMALSCKKIIIVPALVAVGVVQKDIITAAIEQSGLKDRIIYSCDALLPDNRMEEDVFSYIQSSTLSKD